jgi:hypothetical protein
MVPKTIKEYFSELDSSRSSILSKIHQIIISSDKNIDAEVGMMMGKQMIIYKEEGIFKYALSSSKEYLSIHLMTIYGSSPLHSKYQKLLMNAKFQKGCINFKSELDMPSDIVTQLILDSAKINMKKLVEKFHKKGAVRK